MTESNDQRRDWLGVLAQAPRDALALHAGRELAAFEFESLRASETGLVMLRARISRTGDRFNVGEAVVTRCVRRWVDAGVAFAGVGYVLGRDAERAEWVAGFDALLQQPQRRRALLDRVVEPLRRLTLEQRSRESARTAESRVRFFTLQPETAA